MRIKKNKVFCKRSEIDKFCKLNNIVCDFDGAFCYKNIEGHKIDSKDNELIFVFPESCDMNKLNLKSKYKFNTKLYFYVVGENGLSAAEWEPKIHDFISKEKFMTAGDDEIEGLIQIELQAWMEGVLDIGWEIADE